MGASCARVWLMFESAFSTRSSPVRKAFVSSTINAFVSSTINAFVFYFEVGLETPHTKSNRSSGKLCRSKPRTLLAHIAALTIVSTSNFKRNNQRLKHVQVSLLTKPRLQQIYCHKVCLAFSESRVRRTLATLELFSWSKRCMQLFVVCRSCRKLGRHDWRLKPKSKSPANTNKSPGRLGDRQFHTLTCI